MAPVLLVAGDGEGGGENSGVRRMPIDKPLTPPGFYAPPPSDVDLGEEEDFEMATNGERITALEEKVSLVAVATADIPGIKATQEAQGKQIESCAKGVGDILACLQSQGFGTVAPPAAGAGTPAITPHNPSAQLMHYLMPAIRQLPPQLLLLVAAWLLFTGKITF